MNTVELEQIGRGKNLAIFVNGEKIGQCRYSTRKGITVYKALGFGLQASSEEGLLELIKEAVDKGEMVQ